MRYSLHFGPEAMIFEMTGKFTYADTRTFRELMEAIRDPKSRNIIHLNIKDLASIDATALRFLMMAHDFAKKLHRSLVFVAPQGQVNQALREAAMYNLLNIAA